MLTGRRIKEAFKIDGGTTSLYETSSKYFQMNSKF